MAKVRAVVLAAGRGIRMGGEHVKALIPMGTHEPLLYYTLAGLKSAGIDDVLVVTGFRPDTLQEFCAKHGEGIKFTYVFNARYASWGNFHSVRVALDQSPGYDALVVNCDVVVNPEVYARVAGGAGDLVLAVQRRLRLDDEDMRVMLDGRAVRGISKHLKSSFSHGEYTGVSLIRPDAARAYSDVCNAWQWRGTTTGYYEDVYAEILGRVRARAADVHPGEYAEVDKPEDVPAAERVIERFYESPQPAAAS